MNTHAVFEFENTTNIPADKLAFQLVSEISDRLQARGIKCSKITPGCRCPGFVCEIDKTQVCIGLFDFFRHSTESPKKSGLYCFNHFPWWKHLFHRYTEQEFHLGEPLEHFVGVLHEIIAVDSRYVNVKWVTEQEFFVVLDNLKSNATQ
jgi:hypothetical protein